MFLSSSLVVSNLVFFPDAVSALAPRLAFLKEKKHT